MPRIIGAAAALRENADMSAWPDRRLLDLLGIAVPIVQAPMTGADSVELARAVAKAGGLGSLACALLAPDEVLAAIREFRQGSQRPVNLNFFCHEMATPDADAVARWKNLLRPHYERLGLDMEAISKTRLRMPFDSEMCAVVEEVRPEVVSFHFGLPDAVLMERVKRAGAKVIGSATSVREAVWLTERGCDAVIAQGADAGGHRAMFLESDVASQAGLFALLPQVVDAVAVPVIAAGGIADGRGIAAAFALGASGVQIGTAYLLCPEASVSVMYREALQEGDADTAITNLFSGRPARGIVNRYLHEAGPMNADALAFPYAGALVAPLRKASEAASSRDYMQMWAGQGVGLARAMPAEELTRILAAEALRSLGAGRLSA